MKLIEIDNKRTLLISTKEKAKRICHICKEEVKSGDMIMLCEICKGIYHKDCLGVGCTRSETCSHLSQRYPENEYLCCVVKIE